MSDHSDMRSTARTSFPLGTKNGSLAVRLRGTGIDTLPIERRIAIVTDGDGPATPSSASIVLAKKILDEGPPATGAFPCMGVVTLDELMAHLRPLGIWCARGSHNGWDLKAFEFSTG